MTKKYFFLLSSLLIAMVSFGQYSKQVITTDSSSIEIIKDFPYSYIYRETLDNKDSVKITSYFAKDTTKIREKGWQKRNGKTIGIYKVYTIEGDLLYTKDYDTGNFTLNERYFPYHKTVAKVKKIADSLIIANYSQEFFDTNISSNFRIFAYDKEGNVDYVTIPMKTTPVEFDFSYNVRLWDFEWEDEIISVSLDNKGNIRQTSGLEKLDTKNRIFTITREKSFLTAFDKGLGEKETSEFLFWEKLDDTTNTLYDGQFRYYIAELIDLEEEIKTEKRSRKFHKYNVYSFNPWTGEFLEIKKMNRISDMTNNAGFFTDLSPVKNKD